ncbi:MAG: hypothetical protein JRI23_07975 [Deltaproteobacteria bacterium]|nr:hypothetical protein [Deltaproteobacteria bacterium]MBW2531549.1 hypothetical protein [Deltaproteobacteria bacterium]
MPLADFQRALTGGSPLEAPADSAPSAVEGGDAPAAASTVAGGPTSRGVQLSDAHTITCAICLERIPAASPLCPECGEPPIPAPRSMRPPAVSASPGPRSMAPSIADDPPDAGWLRLHWRPLVTMGVIGSLIATGIALRHLAPDRYRPPKHISPPPAAAVCDNPCWHGEACQVGRCVWQPPNDVGHIHTEPVFSGPFSLPQDVVDVLPIDGERFAASSLKGVVIYSARTGEVISSVSDAPQAQRLVRVGSVFYATSPKRIYVIDADTTRVLKTIEVGSTVHDVAIGARGRQALVSVPSLRAVLVIATDYHAEVNRFYFGDDAVGPVSLDDGGKRALATTGRTPLPGLRGPQGGALYAFDPSRLASAQDRVRAAMVGNPSDLVMIPDDQTSYVVLREENRIVPLRRLASGAVRRDEPLETCEQPEQIEIIRRGRRAIVRCNRGRTIEIFDLDQRKLIRHIPLNARAADMVVSPDQRQALIALPHDGAGALGLLDLRSYELTLNELGDEPHRVRMTESGKAAVVVSDRSKVAWVVR